MATLNEISIGPIYAHDNNNDNDNNHRRRRRIGKVAEYRIHPDYNIARTLDYDFLLIRLSSIYYEIVEDTDDNSDNNYEKAANYMPGGYRDDFNNVFDQEEYQ